MLSDEVNCLSAKIDFDFVIIFEIQTHWGVIDRPSVVAFFMLFSVQADQFHEHVQSGDCSHIMI